MRLILTMMVVIFLLAGCGGTSGSSVHETSSKQGTSTISEAASSSGHVFIIIMENNGSDQPLGGNYTASLASKYAAATNYHAVAHPSVPNYLALTSGSTWGIRDDDYHSLSSGEDLGSELTSAGIPWRAYMEDMTKGCFHSKKPYKVKHNPFAYYGGQCPSNVVDLSELEADLSGNTPNFVWITPNLCHDEHSCSGSEGDQWLSEMVPKIMDSAAWKDDGVLFIVWDEDDNKADRKSYKKTGELPASSDRVPLIVVAPNLKSHQMDTYYDHYSLLATVEDRLGVGRLGEAIDAQSLNELF
jgi:hypothetical protein